MFKTFRRCRSNMLSCANWTCLFFEHHKSHATHLIITTIIYSHISQQPCCLRLYISIVQNLSQNCRSNTTFYTTSNLLIPLCWARANKPCHSFNHYSFPMFDPAMWGLGEQGDDARASAAKGRWRKGYIKGWWRILNETRVGQLSGVKKNLGGVDSQKYGLMWKTWVR